jgi:hypothetical protein
MSTFDGISDSVDFRTTLLGRLGWLAMAFAAFVPLCFIGIAFLEAGVTGLLARGWPTISLVLTLFLFCLTAFLYSLWFFGWLGWRISCNREGLRFIALTGLKYVKWKHIESIRCHSRGSFSEFIDLHVLGRRRPYRVNVSGLQPSSDQLHELVSRMVESSRNAV